MEGLFWHTNSKFITWFLMFVLLSSHLQPVMADRSRLQVKLPCKWSLLSRRACESNSSHVNADNKLLILAHSQILNCSVGWYNFFVRVIAFIYGWYIKDEHHDNMGLIKISQKIWNKKHLHYTDTPNKVCTFSFQHHHWSVKYQTEHKRYSLCALVVKRIQ